MRPFHRTAVVATLALLLVAACQKGTPAAGAQTGGTPADGNATPSAPAPAVISSITIGRAIGANKMVVTPMETLAPHDTIYASVSTNGEGTGTKIKALWTMGTETVMADSITLDLGGNATTEFHIMRSGTRGWPAGLYTLAVSLNNGAPTTRTFTIR